MSRTPQDVRIISDLGMKAAEEAKAAIFRVAELADKDSDKIAVYVIATAMLADSLGPTLAVVPKYRELYDSVRVSK